MLPSRTIIVHHLNNGPSFGASSFDLGLLGTGEIKVMEAPDGEIKIEISRV